MTEDNQIKKIKNVHNKNIIAHICLLHVLINVKTKMNCKTKFQLLFLK